MSVDSGTRKSGGAGSSTVTSQVTLQNQGGTLEALSGTLSIGALTGTGGTFHALNGATLDLPANSVYIGTSLSGASAVISGTSSAIPRLSTLGDLKGRLSVLGGAVFNTAGNLANDGSLHIGAGSVVSIPGTFANHTGASLTLDIGGISAGNQYGHLNATGSATLNGSLGISLTNGFAPGAGQSWTILTFANHSGNFDSVLGLKVGSNRFFEVGFNPSSVVLNSLVDAADLAAGVPSGLPAGGVPGQVVTINFQVTNPTTRTAQAAGGSWIDSVYLSRSGVWDLQAKLIGSVQHNGSLAGGGAYNASVTAPLPAADGPYYVIAVADSRRLVADLNRSNNDARSAATIAMSVPVLAYDAPVSGNIGPGQDLYYRVNGQAGVDFTAKAGLARVCRSQFATAMCPMPSAPTRPIHP